jgi:hypothetical protein
MTRSLAAKALVAAAACAGLAASPVSAQCIYRPGTFAESSAFVVLGRVTDVTETGSWLDLERRYTVQVIQITKGPAPDRFTFSIVYPAEPPLHDCGDPPPPPPPPPPRLWPGRKPSST